MDKFDEKSSVMKPQKHPTPDIGYPEKARTL